MKPLLQKPRSAFFKFGDILSEISQTMMQPNGEALRLYSQSQIEFAKIASTELIQSIIDLILWYFSDYATYVTEETKSKIKGLKMESKDVLTLPDLSYRQITKIIRKEIVANRNETTAMRSEVAVLRTEIAAIHKVLEETKLIWASIAVSLEDMDMEMKKSNAAIKDAKAYAYRLPNSDTADYNSMGAIELGIYRLGAWLNKIPDNVDRYIISLLPIGNKEEKIIADFSADFDEDMNKYQFAAAILGEIKNDCDYNGVKSRYDVRAMCETEIITSRQVTAIPTQSER